jgi:hypothetical protein
MYKLKAILNFGRFNRIAFFIFKMEENMGRKSEIKKILPKK